MQVVLTSLFLFSFFLLDINFSLQPDSQSGTGTDTGTQCSGKVRPKQFAWENIDKTAHRRGQFDKLAIQVHPEAVEKPTFRDHEFTGNGSRTFCESFVWVTSRQI